MQLLYYVTYVTYRRFIAKAAAVYNLNICAQFTQDQETYLYLFLIHKQYRNVLERPSDVETLNCEHISLVYTRPATIYIS